MHVSLLLNVLCKKIFGHTILHFSYEKKVNCCVWWHVQIYAMHVYAHPGLHTDRHRQSLILQTESSPECVSTITHIIALIWIMKLSLYTEVHFTCLLCQTNSVSPPYPPSHFTMLHNIFIITVSIRLGDKEFFYFLSFFYCLWFSFRSVLQYIIKQRV